MILNSNFHSNASLNNSQHDILSLFVAIQFSSPNVCSTRDESSEDNSTKKKQNKNENSSEVEALEEKEPSFINHFSLNVESCQETSNKHICKRM